MGRRPSHSQDSFIAAALEIADVQGVGALTVRALGQAVGASATAVYRYFETKEALIDALRDSLFEQVLARWSPDPDPTESLINLGQALRAVAKLHPSLGQVLTFRASPSAALNHLPLVLIDHLARIGVDQNRMVLAYRQVETLALGSAIFDFSGAPHHLRDRQERMNIISRPEFSAELGDEESVARINDQAFEKNLRVVLNSLAGD